MHCEFGLFDNLIKRLILYVSGFLLLIVSTGSIQKASAQNPPVISAFSEPGLIYLNGSNQVVLDVMITDAVDVIAFDFILNWNPGIANRISITPGTFLGSSVWCFLPLENNIPGRVQYVCSKSGLTGVSGSGVLAKITFSGETYGSTALTFTKSELSNSSYGLIYAQRDHGQINNIYQSGIIKFTSLSGEVSLQGQDARGGIPVSLQKGLYVYQGPYLTTSLEQPGTNMFFNSVAMDAYPITTAYPYYLNLDLSANKVKGLVGTSNSLSPLVLLAGNVVDADNEINTEDLDLIRLWFEMTVAEIIPGTELLGDANNDGVVDVRDLALAGGNFGLNGATAYQGWLP